MMQRLSLDLVRAAHERIRALVNRTPVMTSETMDHQHRTRLFFKCENFQKCGVFKARGASNAVFALTDEEARRGVLTHSSGNHAAALARAAGLRNIPAYIVMPTNSPRAKQASVQRYRGEIIFCEPTLQAREVTADKVRARTQAEFIHPYDNLQVMAGQGTAAVELLEDIPELDVILCPVGGGGLLSGVAVAAKSLRPEIRVIAVEPSMADDAYRSFKARTIIPSVDPKTIADGLLTSLGERPFAEILDHVDSVVTVSEESIVKAMRAIWEIMKIIVEPSAAVVYAAVLEGKVDVAGQRVGLVLSGGNLDLDTLPWQKTC